MAVFRSQRVGNMKRIYEQYISVVEEEAEFESLLQLYLSDRALSIEKEVLLNKSLKRLNALLNENKQLRDIILNNQTITIIRKGE